MQINHYLSQRYISNVVSKVLKENIKNKKIRLSEEASHRRFKGDVVLGDDGSVTISTCGSEVGGIQTMIEELSAKAKRCGLSLTVDKKVEDKKFIFKLITETGNINIPGYKYIGFVVPVENMVTGEALDAQIIPAAGVSNTEENIRLLQQSKSVQTCDACHKKMRRGCYFAFVKEEDNSLCVVGSSCAKKYFDLKLSVAVIKFINSLTQIESLFSEVDKSDEEGSYNPMQCYAQCVSNIGRLIVGMAVEEGSIPNPKYVEDFDLYAKCAVDPYVFSEQNTSSLADSIRNKCFSYLSSFDSKFGDDFFIKMFDYYKNLKPDGNDFINSLKTYASYAEQNGFSARSVISLNISAWVTIVYLKSNPELLQSVSRPDEASTEDFKPDGTLISGTFMVKKINPPRAVEYGLATYDKSVTQASMWVIDTATKLKYLISLTQASGFMSTYYVKKYDHKFSIGEELQLKGKVKTFGDNGARKLTYIKFLTPLASTADQANAKKNNVITTTTTTNSSNKGEFEVTGNADANGNYYAKDGNAIAIVDSNGNNICGNELFDNIDGPYKYGDYKVKINGKYKLLTSDGRSYFNNMLFDDVIVRNDAMREFVAGGVVYYINLKTGEMSYSINGGDVINLGYHDFVKSEKISSNAMHEAKLNKLVKSITRKVVREQLIK